MKLFTSFAAFTAILVLSHIHPALAEKIDHHGPSVEADGTFKDCIACHDGSIGSHVRYCTVKCDFQSPHSVLKPYPPKGREQEFAPASFLEGQGIKLEGGKVTCISCHNLRNNGKYHLIKVENCLCSNAKGNALCGACHVKQ